MVILDFSNYNYIVYCLENKVCKREWIWWYRERIKWLGKAWRRIWKTSDGRELLNKKSGFILSKDHYLGTDLKKVLINKNVLVVGRIRSW